MFSMYALFYLLLYCWILSKYYLVHKHKCSFVAVIDLFICWICNAFSFDLFPPFSQIIVPQFIAVKMMGNFGLKKEERVIFTKNVQFYLSVKVTFQAIPSEPVHISCSGWIWLHFVWIQCSASNTWLSMDSWWSPLHKEDHHPPEKVIQTANTKDDVS